VRQRNRACGGPGNSDAHTNPYDKVHSEGTAAETKALVFLGAARLWLDHAARGDVPIADAAVAAQMLLARAETWALAA
jgi:hypothetical protein